MSGSIMPTPLAIPTIDATPPSPVGTVADATLATVSVVIMAVAAGSASATSNGSASVSSFLRTRSIG